MKHNIFNFNQKKSSELGLNLNDLLILQDFIDFSASKKMDTIITDNDIYYWVKYDRVIEQLPILGIDCKRTIARIYKKLTDVGLLKKKIKYIKDDIKGTFTYFTTTNALHDLMYSKDECTEKYRGDGQKSTPGGGRKSTTKESSIKLESSIKDNINTGEQSPPADPVDNGFVEKEVPPIPDNPDETYLRKTGWWLFFQFKEREEKRIGKQFEYTTSEKTAEYGQCKNIVRWICREGITFEQFFKAFDKQRKDKNSLSFNDPYIPRRVSKYKFDDIRKHITPEKDVNDWSGYHASFC